jgi:hypothetical protein
MVELELFGERRVVGSVGVLGIDLFSGVLVGLGRHAKTST